LAFPLILEIVLLSITSFSSASCGPGFKSENGGYMDREEGKTRIAIIALLTIHKAFLGLAGCPKMQL
jgi:hypothetical protein